MSTIGGAIEALKNNGIHFTIVDNAEVHDGGHGFVCCVCGLVFLARRHGRADSTHSTLT